MIHPKYKGSVPLALFILLALLAFLVVKPFLMAIFLGALLAYMIYPLYFWLQGKLGHKTLSALLICFLVLALLVGFGAFFVKTLVQESYVIYILVKQKLAVGLFKGCSNSLCEAIKEWGKSPEVSYQIQEIIKTVTNWVIQKGSGFLLALPRLLLNLFVIFFMMFYFLKDGEQLLGRLNAYLRLRQEKYTFILGRLKEIVHGVVFGYFLIAFIQGALGALGFFIFGISSPLFWGLVMAFLALIPYLGTGIVWIPASLILFLEGLFQDSSGMMLKGAALLVYSFIFVGSADNLLKPKLMGKRARVHPAIIMVGIFGGVLMFGPLGVIIGPLVLSLVAVILEIYLLEEK